MTDADIRDTLARVDDYLRRVCPTMDLRTELGSVLTELDARLATPDPFGPLEPPAIFDLFNCGTGPGSY